MSKCNKLKSINSSISLLSIEATVFADPKDWITINKSFPTVEEQSWNEFRQDSRRFFYSLGRYEVGAHRLTNETITTLLEDYDRTPFNRLNFFFKVSQSHKMSMRKFS